MKIFYHSADLDGHCSGAIVKKKFPNGELYGINYGDEFPWGIIKQDELVYMVDFSLPIEDMKRLNNLASFTWIDHHKTAIDTAHAAGFEAKWGQVLEIGRAACELTWEFLFGTRDMNRLVYLLGRYDVWDLVDGTLELQSGLRMHDTRPTNLKLWDELLGDNGEELLNSSLEIGKILLSKQTQDNIAYAKSCAFETKLTCFVKYPNFTEPKLKTYKIVALNRGLTNSKIFDSVYNSEKHDLMATFVRKDFQWKVTLYSNKSEHDAGFICSQYGGGGHQGAGGFICEELPFRI